jgi:integrase
VRRSLYRGTVDEDKDTDTSTRDLPAGPVVFRFLADLRSSEHNRGEYVFTTTTGTLFTSDSNIRNRVFNSCADAAGIARFSFRSFRRTAATFIHNSGVPLKVQREIMGHTEEEMSLVYSEAEVSLQRKTLEALEERMFGGLAASVLKSLEKPSFSIR